MIFDTIYIHSFETNGHKATLRERLQMRKTCGPYQWKPSVPGNGRGFYQSSNNGLSVGDSTMRLRLCWANDLLPAGARLANITGYYINQFQDETMRPIVARLNHNRGFLIGWTMGAGMLASLEPGIYQDAESAARAAHSHTEYAAEEECRYQAREQARFDAEELAESDTEEDSYV